MLDEVRSVFVKGIAESKEGCLTGKLGLYRFLRGVTDRPECRHTEGVLDCAILCQPSFAYQKVVMKEIQQLTWVVGWCHAEIRLESLAGSQSQSSR